MNDEMVTSDPLRPLLSALLDDELDAAGHEQLEAMVLASEEAMQRYLDVTAVHAMVQWQQQWCEQPVDSSMDEAAAHASADDMRIESAPASRAMPRRARFYLGGWRWSAAAAIVVMAALAALYVETHLPRHQPAAAVVASHGGPVAMMTDVQGAVWADSSRDVSLGESLLPGRFELQSGRVQIMFRSGALVDLRGPCVLDVIDSNHGRLERGEMVAWVPWPAHGFCVDTPGGSVVDLGTEFGLRVDASGEAQVHVFKGHVEVRARKLITLAAGQSVRYDATTVDAPGVSDRTLFAELLRAPTRPAYVHYSFDESTGKLAHDDGRGFRDGPFNGENLWDLPGTAGAAVVDGRFDHARRFDGINDFVQTDYPGVLGESPRTVAMWVRIPNDVTDKQAFAMLSYGKFGPGTIWQMSWNPISKDGPLGALRLGTINHNIVGRTDLRDDKWHHVAVTYDGRRVRLYVDAELEADVEASDIDTTAGSHVTLGKNLSMARSYFRGSIDEVYLFDASLTPGEIRELMRTNQPPTR